MDKAVETQLANIQNRTGKSIEQLTKIVRTCGFEKHGEIRDYLKRELGMGHGDANVLVHTVMKSDGARAAEAAGLSTDDVLAQIYVGPKAALRPIHDKVMDQVQKFGPFDIHPKKGYVSLRRAKQFAMVGPATNTKVEIGINLKEAKLPVRFTVVPPGGMCQFKVRLEDSKEVDKELIDCLRRAYEAAG
jgi:hypothetical protein